MHFSINHKKEADPKGQLLFFFGGGEEKFRRITTEN